jgi:predicted N-formylglutamate amidohydrolase
MTRAALVLTCEHGGNRVPPAYRALFRGKRALLASHRGFDLGAAAVAKRLARRLEAPLFVATTSRLVVDLNRSPGHPKLFSEVTRTLPRAEREEIVELYYTPHREAVTAELVGLFADGRRVVHLALHSFTPTLNGVRRNADVGVLYDPSRAPERAFSERVRGLVLQHDPDLRVRMNYPYRGAADGFTTALRRCFPASRYAGIELELNQELVKTARGIARTARILGMALRDAI